jgi:hypothetical protein
MALLRPEVGLLAKYPVIATDSCFQHHLASESCAALLAMSSEGIATVEHTLRMLSMPSAMYRRLSDKGASHSGSLGGF